jgi:peroxiredoxin
VESVFLLRKKVVPTFEELEATVKENGIGIVVISPGRRFVMQYVKNENTDADVEAILDRLHELGRTLQCLFILVKHTNKKPDLGASNASPTPRPT